MSTHKKTVLQAPADVSELNILGTFYWPDDGVIETTNADHVHALKAHGCTIISEANLARPAATLPLIQVDELGLSALRIALAERGMVYPENYSRAELSEQAHGWNNARRSRQREDNTREAAPIVVDAPAADLDLGSVSDAAFAAEMARRGLTVLAPAVEMRNTVSIAGEIAKPDFMSFDYDDLKGWLTARGVEHRGNQAKAELAAMAAAKFDEMLTARVQSAAA